ncbi:MAG: transposase [Thermoguttaceae bacterium]
MVFHVLNRGVGRRTLFGKDRDFLAFERVIEETLRIQPMRICAFSTLSNHWHMALWPERDGELQAFMQQMTNTHVKRWKEHFRETGCGHLYQGRYKCFPVETEAYFYAVVRYVERNALRANLVTRAENWPWSSLRRDERDDPAFPLLSALAPAETCRLAGDRQSAAIRGGTGGHAPLCEPGIPAGQSRMGCTDGETIKPRVHPPTSWTTKARALTAENERACPC